MRPSRCSLVVLVLPIITGCGTFHNLKDSPNGPMYIGTGKCYPFGGVTRSTLLAVMGPPVGMCDVINGNCVIYRGDLGPGFEQIGQGMVLTTAGLAAIVDVPLSLAGDVLTLPVVYARSRGYPWATWWGEQGFSIPTSQPETTPVDGHKTPNELAEPSH
jgi:hypothetical protein